MIVRRALYIAALLGAIGFYIFHTGYFSWVLLIVAVALLPMELLLSLRCIRTARLEFRVQPLAGEEGYQLTVKAPAAFPVGTVGARLHCHNLFSGKGTKARLRLPAGSKRKFRLSADASPCGAVSFSLQKPRVFDAMGLLRFPLGKAPAPVILVKRPPLPAAPPAMPEEALDQGSLPTQTAGRPGPGALREFSDIREFREGDSIRDVHWKLSAKLDIIMVREGSYSALASPHLCFDFWGDAEGVCGVLGRLEVLSVQLQELERLHGVHWLGPGGQLCSRLVSCRADYDEVLWQLMTTPLPKENAPIAEHLPEVPGPVVVVGPDSLALYQGGALREVLE